MSKYTTQVRFICENLAGYEHSAGYNKLVECIDKAVPLIFDFDFPIFDESYRKLLCTKIIKHYYTREICEETVGLWKLRLDTKMNEIMPYYNQLYKSELIEFNPLYDVEMQTNTDNTTNRKSDGEKTDFMEKGGEDTRTIKSDSSGDSAGTATITNDDTQRNLFSNTPQGALIGVESGEYLTDARKITDDKVENRDTSEEYSTEANTVDKNAYGATTEQNQKTKENIDTLEKYVSKVSGKSAGKSYSAMLKEFRETFLNIDALVINELETLFIGLW